MAPKQQRSASYRGKWLGPVHVQGLTPRALNTACRHLVRNPSIAWDDVPDLPNAAKQILADRFTHSTSQVVNCQTSASKDTSKLLLRLQDGMEVEAVMMHYDTSGVGALYLAVLWSCMLWGQSSALCSLITSRTGQRVSNSLHTPIQCLSSIIETEPPCAGQSSSDLWASLLACQSLSHCHLGLLQNNWKGFACHLDLAPAKGRCATLVVDEGDPFVSGPSSHAVQSRSAMRRQHSSLWPLQTPPTASRMLMMMQLLRPRQQPGAASEPRCVSPHKV